MLCCVPAGVDVEAPIKSEVKITNREWHDKISTLLFLTFAFVQTVLSIVLMTMGAAPCGVDIIGAIADAQDQDLGHALGASPGSFVGGVCLAIFIGLGWVFALQKCAPVIVWGTLVSELIILFSSGIYFLIEGIPDIFYFCAVIGSIALLVMIVKRRAVTKTGEMLQNAAYCIAANPSLVMTCFGVQLLLSAWGTLAIMGLMASFLVGEWDCQSNPPVFVQADWASYAQYFILYTMGWTLFTVQMMRSYICGATTGMWVWHDQENIRSKPCKALGWVCGYSLGSAAIAGIMIAIIDECKKALNSAFENAACMLNPCWWIFRVLWCWYQDAIQAIAKSAVIVASFTGEDFWTSASRGFFLLKGHFTTLIVVNQAANIVLYSGALMFSLLIFFCIWIWGESESGGLVSSFDLFQNQGAMFQIGIMIIITIVLYYSLIGIFVLGLFSQYVAMTLGNAFVCALFGGCISSYILGFFAGVILDVSDSMYVISLIDKRNGRRVSNMNPAVGSADYVALYYQKETESMTGVQMEQVHNGGQIQQGGAAPVVAGQTATAPPAYDQQSYATNPAKV